MSGSGIITRYTNVPGAEQAIAPVPDPPENPADPVSLGEFKKYHFSINSTPFAPDGTTETISFATNAINTLDLGSAPGDVTLTLTNPAAGARYTIFIIQGATARNVIWPASVKFPQGQAPILSSADNAVDKVELIYDGTNYYGDWNVGYA